MDEGGIKVMLTCKNATKLISRAQEQQLTLRERISLRFHFAICSGCTNYRKQISFIRKACEHYVEGNPNNE